MSPPIPNMVTIAWLVSVVHSSNSSLRDIDNCRQGSFEPKVTVANSSHLLVSWEGVFPGCSRRKVEVILDKKVTRIQVEQMSTALPADVCQKHTVTVALEHEDSTHAHVLVFNENTFKIANTRRYGGLLEDVRHTICRKSHEDNYTVVSLDIPEKISRCILSGNEAKVEQGKHASEPSFIQMEIINPEVANESLTIDVELIKSHPENCECQSKSQSLGSVGLCPPAEPEPGSTSSPDVKNGDSKQSGALPLVEAVNSTHFWISWNNTFTEQCNRETIESVTVTLDSKDATIEFELEFEEMVNVFLSFDPCETQTLSVTLNLKDGSEDRVFTNQVSIADSVFCDLRPEPLDLDLAFLIPLVTIFLVVLTVVVAILYLRRNKDRPCCCVPLRFTPIQVHHLPDATYLPTPWSQSETETETQSSSESQQSSSSRNGLLTPSTAAKVETELLVDLNGSTIKKTTMKRPKTDGVKSVDLRYKWQLTNVTSDGEEEELTILEGGGRSNQASPDPRRNPGRFPSKDKPDFSLGGFETDQVSGGSSDSNEILVVGRLVIGTEEEGSRSNQTSPHPRQNPGHCAHRDGPDIQQGRSQTDLPQGASNERTDKILVVETNPEQTESSIYLK